MGQKKTAVILPVPGTLCRIGGRNLGAWVAQLVPRGSTYPPHCQKKFGNLPLEENKLMQRMVCAHYLQRFLCFKLIKNYFTIHSTNTILSGNFLPVGTENLTGVQIFFLLQDLQIPELDSGERLVVATLELL